LCTTAATGVACPPGLEGKGQPLQLGAELSCTDGTAPWLQRTVAREAAALAAAAAAAAALVRRSLLGV
jgi:tagatose-1,6-bisphosphate aldolase non-catalytic subunit AgaZ/GatZ